MFRLLLLISFVSTFSFAQKRSIELSSVFHRYYEKSMQNWQGLDSVVFNYDNQGNLIDEIHFEGDDSLVKSYRKTFSFIKKNVDREFSYFWNFQTNSWDTISKTDFAYNSKDSIQSIVSYGLTKGIWQNVAKENFQYDQTDNLIHHDMFVWDTISNQWIVDNTNSWDFSYDQNARRVSKTTNVWNQQAKKLIQSQKELYSYNQNDELALVLRQVWDNQNMWHDTGKDSIVYSNGLKVENYTFYFDEIGGGVWLKTAKDTYTYNQNSDIAQVLIQYWSPKLSNYVTDENTRLITSHYDGNNRLVFREDQMYDTVSKSFTDYDQTYFYYQNFQMAGLPQKSIVEQIQILPNPAFDSFVITANAPILKVKILDATGKLIKEVNAQQSIVASYTIDVTDLSDDIYFTTIETSEGAAIHKLLVKR
jgi:hypothetical protein